MALAIPVWGVIVATVGGILTVIVISIIIWQCFKMKAKKREAELTAGENFAPTRRLTIRRGQVVPASRKRRSGVVSSIFGDRSYKSRHSTVTDVEKAESQRSRSPFGIWPSSSYYAQEDGPSDELTMTHARKKRNSTRPGNMELLRDADRHFLRQISIRERSRKQTLEPLRNSPPMANGGDTANESQRPGTGQTNRDRIEEVDEPSSPERLASPRALLSHPNNSQWSLSSAKSARSKLSIPRSKFSSSTRIPHHPHSPAQPSPLSTFHGSKPTPASKSPRTPPAPQTPRGSPDQLTVSDSARAVPKTVVPGNSSQKPSAAVPSNSLISPKGPSQYGTVTTTITATNPLPRKDSRRSRSRSKSRSPSRRSRSLSRSRSQNKSSVDTPRPSLSQSKPRGRSPKPHPAAPKNGTTSDDPTDPSASLSNVKKPSSNLSSTTSSHTSITGTKATPPNASAGDLASFDLVPPAINFSRSRSISDISSNFSTGQAAAQPITLVSPIAITTLNPDLSLSPLPSSRRDQAIEKSLPQSPPPNLKSSVVLPAVIPPQDRPGDDVVLGVGRSQSKKGKVLRKQSRNSVSRRKSLPSIPPEQ